MTNKKLFAASPAAVRKGFAIPSTSFLSSQRLRLERNGGEASKSGSTMAERQSLSAREAAEPRIA